MLMSSLMGSGRLSRVDGSAWFGLLCSQRHTITYRMYTFI